jgi:hypothetical protein
VSRDKTIPEALARIYKRDKELRASCVVDAARSPSSPLHSKFEWDDAVAGEKPRLYQARTLIRSVRIIELDGQEERLIHVPAIASGEEGSYQIASVLVEHVDELARAMRQAQIKLRGAAAALGEVIDLMKNSRRKRRFKEALQLLEELLD